MQNQPWYKKMMQGMCSIWRFLRSVLGWFCIGLGILGLVLPILNGTFFLAIGIMLVGRRHPVLRWWSVHIKLFFRQWAKHSNPMLRRPGRWALSIQQNFSRQRRRFSWWYQGWRSKQRAASLC
jgi:hypothetical protein